MKKIIPMLIVLMGVFGVWADINIFPELSEPLKLPKPAKDPISGEIVKVELEVGYVYDRTLAVYNRTKGTFDHKWGFTTPVHYGELWQYKWKSHVLYADDNYVVEYVDIDGSKAASSKLIVESKRELKENLSDCFQDIVTDTDVTNKTFTAAERALFKRKFLGLTVKTYEDGEQFLNKNDDVRAFRESFGFHGKQYIVIHNLKEGGDPFIWRVTWSGLELVLWKGPAPQENKENWAQTKMLKQAILCVDLNLVPGEALYEPGATWEVKAKNLARFITPYTRVDKFDGGLTFKTDEKPRKFNGEKHLKIYTTAKGEDARLDFVKQLRKVDKSSKNQWDHWHGCLVVQVDKFHAYIRPVGGHSYIHYLYSKSEFKGDGEKSTEWWKPDPELDAKITGETAYYCSREKKKDKELKKQGLKVASTMFSAEGPGKDGEDCPWKD